MKRLMWVLGPALLALIAAVAIPTTRAVAQDQNVDEMIANAKTPADHEAIAAYYDKEAAAAGEKAEFHKKISGNYARFKMKPTEMSNHCYEISQDFQRIANEDKALAAAHRKMAQEAGEKTGQ